MDEIEYERRRACCLDNLCTLLHSLLLIADDIKCTIFRMSLIADLEKQFTILRELLYYERVAQVDMNVNDIWTSPEYLVPLARLDESLQSRIEVAGILNRLKKENISHKFDSEEQAARQHFESEKQLAKDMIHNELMDKIRRLKEDRHNTDISWADWCNSTRTSKVRGPARKKAVTVSGPYIVYMLSEEDILEDWKIIRKALKRTTTTSSHRL